MDKTQGKLTYGNLVHLLIYSYIIHILKGKTIKNKEQFRSIILKNKKFLKSIATNGRISEGKLNYYINLTWKRFQKSKPTALINFIRNLYNKNYSITVEKPLVLFNVKVRKDGVMFKRAKMFRADLFLINSKKKHIVIIDVKSGTRRRKKTYYKQIKKYRDVIKSQYKGFKVDMYIYWFRYDKLEKVNKK